MASAQAKRCKLVCWAILLALQLSSVNCACRPNEILSFQEEYDMRHTACTFYSPPEARRITILLAKMRQVT
jgi:hypothetical protein